MASSAFIGYGTTFSRGDSVSGASVTYTAVGEILNIGGPNTTNDTVDVTNMDSPNNFKEFITGLTDPGQFTVTYNWLVTSTLDAEQDGIRSDQENRLLRDWRITFPSGAVGADKTCTFTALVINIERNLPNQEALTATVTMQISGAITWSVA